MAIARPGSRMSESSGFSLQGIEREFCGRRCEGRTGHEMAQIGTVEHFSALCRASGGLRLDMSSVRISVFLLALLEAVLGPRSSTA